MKLFWAFYLVLQSNPIILYQSYCRSLKKHCAAESIGLFYNNNCFISAVVGLSSPALGQSLESLSAAIPGVPGDDYPIFSEVPETSFLCDGQVDGGYYADPESECQAFHICANNGQGGLTKYSFLCPNGTLFQQQYFVCDWWFNVDCSLAESLWGRNLEVEEERLRYTVTN